MELSELVDMISTPDLRDDFLRSLISRNTRQIDLVAAVIWAGVARDDPVGFTIASVCETLERIGTAQLNPTRIRQNMTSDRRFVRTKSGAYRISPKERLRLDEIYTEAATAPPAIDSGSVLPVPLFVSSRKYTQSVVRQINLSYDAKLFDCCAVMCRRLFETLIIEAFEKQGALDKLRKPDGDLMQLSGLISALESETQISFGRQTKQAARKLKDVGDWSAHNRRHNAVANDIDRIRDGFRVACGDLLHLAGQD